MARRPRADILNIGFFDWDGEHLLTGGAERYITDLCQVLSEMGYTPRLVQNARRPFTRNHRGIEVVGIVAAEVFDLPKMATAFASVVGGAALVIASPVELASAVPAGPVVVGINHGVWWDHPDHRADAMDSSRHVTLLAALRRAAACVCVDTNFINWLRTFDGEALDRLEYVPNYVDLNQFKPHAKDFNASRLSVLYPRRLCDQRGIVQVFAAFDDLFARDQPFDLHLCGGGPPSDVARAREFVARHPARARLTEAAMIDMPAVYADSHIVIIPTINSEGTSLSCLEAMATGNGVIATHVGGLPNLVLDGVNGLLIKPTATALTTALVRFAEDRALLAALAERAVGVSNSFAIGRWRARWREILQRVANVPGLDPLQAPDAHARGPKAPQESGGDPRDGQPPPMRRTKVVPPGAADWGDAARDELQESLRAAISERDGAYRAVLVASLDRDAAIRDAAQAELARDEALSSRDEACGECDEAHAARDSACAARDEADAARDQAILSWKAAFDAYTITAEERDRFRAEGDAARNESERLAAVLTHESATHAGTREQLARAVAQLDVIRSSRGWRALQYFYRTCHVLMPWRKGAEDRTSATNGPATLVTNELPVPPSPVHSSPAPSAPSSPLPAPTPPPSPTASTLLPRQASDVDVVTTPATGNGKTSAGDKQPTRLATMRPEYCALVPGLVSVVLPVYNGARLLEGAIRSVLAQTYRPFELIVVDDGSADDTQQVLEQFAGHPDVRILVQSNQRLPRALTHGFAHARGEFWTWTSADNLMGRHQLERLVAKLRAEPDLGMTYADYRVIDERGNPLADRAWRASERPEPHTGAIHLPHTTERINLIPDNFIGPCFLYRGWIGRLLGDYDPAQGVEDYDYWMRINALFSIRHLGTDELLYWYRVHADTLSARAEHHAIPEKVDALMRTEIARAAWFAKPLALHADAKTAEWLVAKGVIEGSGDIPEGTRGKAASAYAVVTGVPAVAKGVSGNGDFAEAPLAPTAIVAIARATSGSELPATAGDAVPLVLVFASDGASPYDVAALLSRPNVLAVVFDARDAARVRALSKAPIVDGDAVELAAALSAFARDTGFWVQTHGAGHPTEMPAVPFIDVAHPPRIALQVDRATESVDGQAIVDHAVALRQAGFDPVILARCEARDLDERAKAAGIAVDVRNDIATADAYGTWLRDHAVELVNARDSTFGTEAADALGIPFVQTLLHVDATLSATMIACYRDADRATTAYAFDAQSSAQHADMVLGLDPAKFRVIGSRVDAETQEHGDPAAAHARLFRSLLTYPR